MSTHSAFSPIRLTVPAAPTEPVRSPSKTEASFTAPLVRAPQIFRIGS
jgi:hypothetical protein